MVFGGGDPTHFLRTATCSIKSDISAENVEISEERMGGRVLWALEVDI